MFKSLLVTVFASILILGVVVDADARRFGGSFKFSSAKSWKSPSYRGFSKKTTARPRATAPRTTSQRSTSSRSGFGGSSRATTSGASRSASSNTRFARTPTNNFRNTRQQSAYRNYQTQQQSKFRGTAKQTSSTASSSPIYRQASRGSNQSRSNYWDRRDGFYGGWNTPNYVYMGSPAYGMFDGLFLGYMLGHAMTPHYSAFAYHHQNDEGMKAWMEEMEAQAAENAEIRAQLNLLKAEMAKLEGTPIDPSFLPAGIDPDLVLAPDLVRTLAPTFRLCTASPEGNYHRFAQTVQQFAAQGVLVEIVNTKGSMQNLEYLGNGRCDGAYVQRNAFTTYAERNPSGAYNFERISTPAVEFAHMICNRDSGVDDVGDLIGKSLLIDEVGSGTEVTWHEFVSMDSNYSDVYTQSVGGMTALNRVATGEADCMLFVASLNTTLLQRANGLGDNVVLVPVNDWDFNDKKYGNGKLFKGYQDPSGESVYVFLDIPDDQYENIQDGFLFSEVETLTVPVDMVASLDWRKDNPEAYESLLGAVIDAQPTIASLVSEH